MIRKTGQNRVDVLIFFHKFLILFNYNPTVSTEVLTKVENLKRTKWKVMYLS